MDLLEDFNFVMIHVICKVLVLLKNHLTRLKDNIFKFFFKKYNGHSFIKKMIFYIIYNDGKSKFQRKKKY